MSYDELNKLILHYIEKDQTGKAIMLSGAWGTGKSYYIKNNLIPFLNSRQDDKHDCIVVSLYGLSDLSEISKAIYFETRMKKITPKSETAKATVLVGKTVLKGIASHFGVDLNADKKFLQYASIPALI